MAVSIVSSVIAAADLQRDGRTWVREHHVDSLGAIYERIYLAAVGFNIAAALAAYPAILLASLTAGEIANNLSQVVTLGSLATVQFVYSTVAQNVAALRVAYAVATQEQAVMMGDYLNTLSSAQLQAAFGLTAGQVTTLKTNKLTPATTLATSIRTAAGQ